MSEFISSYRIRDFLLFSRDVYFDLFETYNQEIFPQQILWLLVSAVIAWALYRRVYSSAVCVVVAAAWFYTAWFFHFNSFATINWSARYSAYAFAFEGLLFGLLAFRAGFGGGRTGSVLFFIAAFLPYMLLVGQSVRQIQLFGWGADAVALGSIGVLLTVRKSFLTVIGFVLPLLWLVLSAMIYFGIKT